MARAEQRRLEAKEAKRSGISEQELADRDRSFVSPLGGVAKE